MSVTIRRADESDLDTVVAMRMEFLSAVHGDEDEPPPDFVAATRSFLQREASLGRAVTWLAERDGRAVGVVTLLIWPRPPLSDDDRTFDGYIINMFVESSSQGQGIGRRLLDACLDGATPLGVRSISLQPTEAGRPLYDSTEFEPQTGRLVRRVSPSPRSGAGGGGRTDRAGPLSE